LPDLRSQPAFQLKLLGGFSAHGPRGEPLEIVGQKDRALLAYLALSPSVAHGRDKLAALLWSDHGERQARDSLKQCLLRLRRALAQVQPDAVAGDRQTVAFQPSDIEVDAVKFAQLAATAGGIDQAVDLFQGDLLDGLTVRAAAFEDWLLVERQRLRQLAIDALSRSLAQAQAAGQRDSVAVRARRLLSLDPLQEGACRALMQLHADRAERAQALKLFETFRDRLQQELGVKPELETLRLYDAIRLQRAGAPFAAPTSEAPVAVAPVQPKPSAKPSIAVLPFQATGDDPETEQFADGLTEAIIIDLSQVSGLFTAARHSVFAVKGRMQEVPRIARELNVRYVISGSVRKAGDRLRITAQLIDTGTSGHVWGMRYDRSLSDIFALQDEISKTIADVLKVQLLPSEMESIASRSTSSSAAYEYFLRGRSFYLRGLDKRCLRIARDMYAKAAEIDPGYARAHAGIAICDGYLTMSDPRMSWATALRESEHALELEPNLAEAHAARGLALNGSGRHREAALAFQQALELNPNLFEACFFWGEVCQVQGQREQAVALFQRAAELRPNDYRSLGFLATAYKIVGDQDQAMAAARRCFERVEAAVKLHPDNAGALAFGAIALAEMGRPQQAEDWATRALMIGPDDHLVQYNIACAQVLLGNHDAAIAHLESAFAASPDFRRWLAEWLAHDADFDPLRPHPRFLALTERLTLEHNADAAGDRPSIAVLPFANIDDDPEQEYFADGLTEDIVTDLSQVSSLFVAARHSIQAYKGRRPDVRKLAQDLNVDYVLEGAVRKEGRCVRINARLTDGATGDHLWADRYDRSVDDIFALQDEISKSIVDTHRVKLLPVEIETIASRSTKNPEAYEHYLLGRSFYLRGMDSRSLRIARDFYAKACEIDSAYARARAGLAICESHLSMRDPAGAAESPLRNSELAIELAPNSAEAHAAKGLALYVTGRFAEAGAMFDRAMTLDANLFEAYFFDGRCRRIQGQRELAAARFARAAELRPNDFRSVGMLAEEYRALGRHEDSCAAERRCLERLAVEVKAHPENSDAWAFGSAVLAHLDEPARAAVWASRALIMTPGDYLVLYNIARTCALLGDIPGALDHLERAFNVQPAIRRRLAAWLPLDQDFDPLRIDPRFCALKDKLGRELSNLE
jgi:adenylate cyclase